MKSLIIEFFRNLYLIFISMIFPNKCASCGKIIERNDFLCVHCHNNIERLDKEKVCLICGYEKDDCICKSRVYHFEKIICVFKKEGIAQKAYYKYKFVRKIQNAEYFAQQISLDVLNLFNDVKFDYICNVPTAKSSIRRYGFDHCAEITRRISKILNIPYAKNVLICDKASTQQHKATFKERLKNVNGKYSINGKISGNVLLIDDIRTTGATLDECAKMLLFAGADTVYCATALTTMLNNKKDDLQKKLNYCIIFLVI